MTQAPLQSTPLALIGAGHTHLVGLRRWRDRGFRPPAGSVLINPDPEAWYSGMMPGLLAGRYQPEDCAIALEPLCANLGIELVIGQLAELNADQRLLRLDDGRQYQAELLSLNIGSSPACLLQDGSLPVIPAKPFAALYRQWRLWRDGHAPVNLALAGAGPAAFELALALQASLPNSRVSLIGSTPLLARHPSTLQRRALRLLHERGIDYQLDQLTGIRQGRLLLASGIELEGFDALVLATGAQPHACQQTSGLHCDPLGFIAVDSCLRSLSHSAILASGDCAKVPDSHHCGVHAVRQGQTLADNLQALLCQQPLQRYQPQSRTLALLDTSDGRALLSYGRLAAAGRWARWWKTWLDTRFISRHRAQ